MTLCDAYHKGHGSHRLAFLDISAFARTCCSDKKLAHENVAGTCPRDMLQRHVPSCKLIPFYLNCATPIWGIYCPRDMSHKIPLAELHGTRRGDKTLQRCHVTSSVRLCNMSPYRINS